jgi:hypothetical protein
LELGSNPAVRNRVRIIILTSMLRGEYMTHSSPLYDLRERIETVRLQLVEELAAKGGPLPPDTLQKIALIQSALTAVREEIKNHEVKVGGGGELPLK